MRMHEAREATEVGGVYQRDMGAVRIRKGERGPNTDQILCKLIKNTVISFVSAQADDWFPEKNPNFVLTKGDWNWRGDEVGKHEQRISLLEEAHCLWREDHKLIKLLEECNNGLERRVVALEKRLQVIEQAPAAIPVCAGGVEKEDIVSYFDGNVYFSAAGTTFRSGAIQIRRTDGRDQMYEHRNRRSASLRPGVWIADGRKWIPIRYSDPNHNPDKPWLKRRKP
jgi:hypothetical protein